MLDALTHSYSPLSQAQRRADRTASVADTDRRLSPADQATLGQILADKCDVIPNPAFTKADAYRKLFEEPDAIPMPDISWYHPLMENLDDRVMKSVRSSLLTGPQERVLFLQFNYCRHMVAKLRKQIGDTQPTVKQAHEIIAWYRRAQQLRDQIASSNLALVLAMAKRMRLSELDFTDLISEGNLALLRAVDKFDAARGFKFSTYACRAILKAFSRSGVKLSKYRQVFPTEFDPEFEKSDHLERRREGHETDCVDEIRDIVRDNRANLTDVERSVIQHRFGISFDGTPSDPDKTLTLDEVGKIIGLTKERVRQIQNAALDKIRTKLEDDFLG